MQQLAWSDFAGAEGSVFHIDAGDGQIALALETAAELPSSGRVGGSFRLEFRGPVDPVLPQDIYRFHREGESCEIFVVPVGRDESGTLYEAIFY